LHGEYSDRFLVALTPHSVAVWWEAAVEFLEQRVAPFVRVEGISVCRSEAVRCVFPIVGAFTVPDYTVS